MSQIARFLEGIFSLLFLSIDIACFSVWINVVEHVDFGEGGVRLTAGRNVYLVSFFSYTLVRGRGFA